MKICFITFRSITYAQRGQDVLNRAGIRTGLGRTPRSLEQKGCGYGLRLARREAERALALLRESGVPFGKLYCRNDRGEPEAIL